MSLQQIIALIVVTAVICSCFYLLRGILRFSVISSRRTRGWQTRLRQPRIEEVEAKWNVWLPRELESFYKTELVERSEFYLAAPGADQSNWWYIAHFIPLTALDVSEWMATTKIPGIPIALDAGRGIYYLPFEALRSGQPPAVLLLDGDRKTKGAVVAPSIEAFMKYQTMEVLEEKD